MLDDLEGADFRRLRQHGEALDGVLLFACRVVRSMIGAWRRLVFPFMPGTP